MGNVIGKNWPLVVLASLAVIPAAQAWQAASGENLISLDFPPGQAKPCKVRIVLRLLLTVASVAAGFTAAEQLVARLGPLTAAKSRHGALLAASFLLQLLLSPLLTSRARTWFALLHSTISSAQITFLLRSPSSPSSISSFSSSTSSSSSSVVSSSSSSSIFSSFWSVRLLVVPFLIMLIGNLTLAQDLDTKQLLPEPSSESSPSSPTASPPHSA